MDMKMGLIGSLVLNVLLVALMIYVKKDAHQQAKDFVKPIVEKSNYQLSQANEIMLSNNVLWELILEIHASSDKSLATITRLSKEKRLPNRTDEKAFLTIDATSVDGNKARRIGWEKYSFTVVFDSKDKFLSLNADDLLGKASVVEPQ